MENTRLEQLEAEYVADMKTIATILEELSTQHKALETHYDELFDWHASTSKNLQSLRDLMIQEQCIEDAKSVDMTVDVVNLDYIQTKRLIEAELDEIEAEQKRVCNRKNDLEEDYKAEKDLLEAKK